MEPITTSAPVVLTAAAIAALREEPLGQLPGVTHRVLWRAGTSMAGVLTVRAGHHLGAHAHRVNHHHIWVLSGQLRILDQDVGPGSYVHVPSGVAHDLDARASAGGTVFYLYVPPGE